MELLARQPTQPQQPEPLAVVVGRPHRRPRFQLRYLSPSAPALRRYRGFRDPALSGYTRHRARSPPPPPSSPPAPPAFTLTLKREAIEEHRLGLLRPSQVPNCRVAESALLSRDSPSVGPGWPQGQSRSSRPEKDDPAALPVPGQVAGMIALLDAGPGLSQERGFHAAALQTDPARIFIITYPTSRLRNNKEPQGIDVGWMSVTDPRRWTPASLSNGYSSPLPARRPS